MEAHQALERRRSTRWFLDRPVDPDDLKTIVVQGLHAPSWVNSQPYHAHIVTGETLQRIKDDYLEASRNGKESKPELPPTPLEDWSRHHPSPGNGTRLGQKLAGAPTFWYSKGATVA